MKQGYVIQPQGGREQRYSAGFLVPARMVKKFEVHGDRIRPEYMY